MVDVFSRRVVGWQLSTSLRTDLALGALEMGIWTRQREGRDVAGVTRHSDKGVQHLAVRYTQRLADAVAVAEYIDWFNHRRLHGEIGLIPPAEHEDTYYRRNTAPAHAEASAASLH